MTAHSKRSPERCPTHPGALLRDIVLPALPVPKTEVARALGISRQSLYDILAEKQPVTPAKRCGSPPCSGLRPHHGSTCRRRSTSGMRSGRWIPRD